MKKTGATMTRAQFLKACAAATGGLLLDSKAWGESAPKRELPEKVLLKKWEFLELPAMHGMRKGALRITASNGAFGISRTIGDTRDLARAEAAAKGMNLLDHEALNDAMAAHGVPQPQLAMFDIACWDLHARMLNKPLHAVLGTKREKVPRYGDVRGTQPNFSPQQYAGQVARYLERSGMRATKLHFPGAMGTADCLTFKQVLETLETIRKEVGRESILIWDPYPRSAESATPALKEAIEICKRMEELGYAWIEGPLPPVPFETQIPKYVELRKATNLRIQAEGPNSPIGDGTPFAVMKQWAEAGAINMCASDIYLAGGFTNVYRLLEYARTHPELGLQINTHWAWAPHAHLAMAYEEKVFPIVEFPMGEDMPPSHMTGPWLLAPDWPGIYRLTDNK